MRRFTALLLAALMLLSLAACGQGASAGGSAQNAAGDPTPEEEAPELPEPEPYEISDPTVMPEGGVRDGVTYAAYDGIVEHLFFHPVVAYPELAFDGDAQANGIDDYMVTVDEYNKILQSVYDKGYVLVDIGDVWSETTGEDGQPKMVRNTLYLPEGKKPLILSYDDTNYYEYMLANGFTYKLVIGEDGKIASWGKAPQGNEVTSRDLDAIPILDKFVEELKKSFDVKTPYTLTPEYLALQNQINPHFLYNTLEGIRAEALIAGVDSIAEMTEALATYFRYTISQVNNLVTLEEELANVENYYYIQQFRFGSKLDLRIRYDCEDEEEALMCQLPKLTLQPIVENSIYHGLERKIGTGHLDIKVTVTDSHLIIMISDDGVGIEKGQVKIMNEQLRALRLEEENNGETGKKGGIAVKNVNNRIKLLFGEEYGIYIYSQPDVGTEITLPVVRN